MKARDQQDAVDLHLVKRARKENVEHLPVAGPGIKRESATENLNRTDSIFDGLDESL